MTTTAIAWQTWAPPLDPPVEGGLPLGVAQEIADQLWDSYPHCAAAEMWEAYAATLPPTAAVASVQTGAQAVTYNPAMPGGDYGLALARAAWHRSLCEGQQGTLVSAPLTLAFPGGDGGDLPLDWWQRDLEDPP
jgi:hypothetical protein